MARSATPVEVASKFIVWLSRNRSHGEVITGRLLESLTSASNYWDARDSAQRLDDMGNLSPEILDAVEAAFIANRQIHGSVIASPIVERILVKHHRKMPKIPS